MKCPKCGKEIAKDSFFCEYCGTQVKKNRKPLFIAIAIVACLLIFGGIGLTMYNKGEQEQARIERELLMSKRAAAEAEAKAKAEHEARLKAEAEAKAKAEHEARLKAEAEAKAKAEHEARLKAEAEAEAEAKAEHEARLKAEAEAKAKAEHEARLKAEAEAAEAERRLQEAEAERKRQEKYARTHGNIKGHEYVDLGLSVKWATCNVGANKPEDYGNYYAWGETSTKFSYAASNGKTKGKKIKDIKGNSQYDAARASWGGTWRLPTKAELEELNNKCTWKWTTHNGVKGYKVTGPNGNSIFLPASGYRNGLSLFFDGGDGDYWSSTPYESGRFSAYSLGFDSSRRYMDYNIRGHGRSVRPVSE